MLKTLRLFLTLCALLPLGLAAQEIAVSGSVTDARTGEPIVGATIRVKDAGAGAQTDIDGNFQVKCRPDALLVVSYTGFETAEIAVGNRPKVDVQLSESASKLDEVVVVGYGVQRKSQITGAISSIQNKDFRDKPVSNLANSIQGRVSGLNVSTTSGTPGAGLLVSVRGANSPLYVVDGVPLLSESNSALSTAFDLQGNTIGSGQTLSSVSDINPNDIESIEILKDASAAAIYGARAANGVVLITTKRGKQGKTETEFNIYQGFQQVSRPIQFLNSQQFVELVEEARANDLALYEQDNSYFGDDFDPSVLTDPLENFDLSTGVDTDWIDEVTQTAPIGNYELSFRGGNDKTRFFSSAGYFDQTGIVVENFYKRFNYRLNLDHNVGEKFQIGTTLSATRSNNRRSFNDDTYTGIITNAIGASPLMPAFEADGSYARFEDYQANWLSDNPAKSAREIRARTQSSRFLGTTYGEYAFTPRLRLRSAWSADATFLNDKQFKSPLTSDAEAVGGQAFESNFRALTWLNENTLNFNQTFGEHALSLLGGVTAQRTQIESSSATGQGFPPGGLERVSSAAQIVSATSFGTGYSILSFIGRANYDFQNRYLVTASLRADGSSRFSKDNRFGYFPSASVAWRVSSERFFDRKFFSDLKFRVSYGLTGDQEIGDFQNVTFYAPSRYDGLAGIQIRNIADPDLSWQSNRMLNVGFDYEIKQGLLSGAVEFFKSNKNRLLSEDVVPGTTGFATVTRNRGEVQNLGVEFNLTASPIRRKNLRWTLNFNTTYVKNEIKDLSSDGILLNAYNDLEATHILKIGQPLGSFVGVKYLGVDPDTGDPLYEDSNGDGVVDFDDAQIIGQALPNWFGGLTNSLSIGRWDATVFVRYVAGNQVYNLIRATSESLGWSNEGGLSSVYANNTTDVLNRWRRPGDVAEYPRASFVNSLAYQNSSQFLENGAFLRLQNLTLGYTFRKVRGLDNLRLYFEGQNLWVLTQYKGFDPEVSSTGASTDRTAGVDYGAYPQARVLLLGANVRF
jgi:TonB-dependent starch-binding outer membrane protein SusC